MDKFPKEIEKEFKSEIEVINAKCAARERSLAIVSYPRKNQKITPDILKRHLQASLIKIVTGFPRGALQRKYDYKGEYPNRIESFTIIRSMYWSLFCSGMFFIKFPLNEIDIIKFIWQVALTAKFSQNLFNILGCEYSIGIEINEATGTGFKISSTNYADILEGITIEPGEWIDLPKLEAGLFSLFKDKLISRPIRTCYDFGDAKDDDNVVSKVVQDIIDASSLDSKDRTTVTEVAKKEVRRIKDLLVGTQAPSSG